MAATVEQTLQAEIESRKHIENVRRIMTKMFHDLLDRMQNHDRSKLEEPEAPVLAEYTPLLAKSTYGSPEYQSLLQKMKEGFLDHHYRISRHHPEHFGDGINGMNLLDLIEMIADWKAATLRHDDGDIRKSIEHNKERFGLSDQLVAILLNTVELFEK